MVTDAGEVDGEVLPAARTPDVPAAVRNVASAVAAATLNPRNPVTALASWMSFCLVERPYAIALPPVSRSVQRAVSSELARRKGHSAPVRSAVRTAPGSLGPP